jgi:hypothetical protein
MEARYRPAGFRGCCLSAGEGRSPQFLLAADKEYEVTPRLGVETDTPTRARRAQRRRRIGERRGCAPAPASRDLIGRPPVHGARATDDRSTTGRAGLRSVARVTVHTWNTGWGGPAPRWACCSKGIARPLAFDLGRALAWERTRHGATPHALGTWLAPPSPSPASWRPRGPPGAFARPRRTPSDHLRVHGRRPSTPGAGQAPSERSPRPALHARALLRPDGRLPWRWPSRAGRPHPTLRCSGSRPGEAKSGPPARIH